MAETKISQIGSLYANGATPSVDQVLMASKVSFGDMMNKMSDQTSVDSSFDAGTGIDSNVGNQVPKAASAEAYDRYQYKENSVNEYQETQYEVTEETTEAVDEFEGEVYASLKDALDVTDEDIANAMQILGFNVLDLADQSNMTALVAELTGTEDISELLLNDNFMTVLDNLSDITDNLLDTLDISMHDLQDALSGQAENNTTVDISVLSGDDIPDTLYEENADPAESQTLNAAGNASSVVAEQGVPETDEPLNVEIIKTDDKSDAKAAETKEAQAATEDVNVTEDISEEISEVKSSDEADNKPDGGAKNAKSESGQTQTAVLTNETAKALEALETQQTSETPFAQRVEVSDIIRQIAEQVRISNGNNETSIEMQLNPEHLGKLYLEVSAKAGSVSAHITAQNEAVKAALETQVAELKENLNQAGVKVDAVEVTVGSHEFERNLEQNAKKEEQEAARQEKESRGMRSIRLDSLDDLKGLMSDEEALAAQIMADEGNTMNLKA